MAEADERAGAIERPPGESQAMSVDDMRRELETSRQRMSQDLDTIEHRLRRLAERLRARFDLLQPARARIREDIWGSLALAFGAGLALALITARRRDGRRSFAGQVVRSAAVQLPGALVGGIRAGIGDALRQEWRGYPDNRARKRVRASA